MRRDRGRRVAAALALCLIGCAAALFRLEPAMAQEVPGPADDRGPAWRLDGDLRLRGEADRDRRSQDNRERARVRLRLGAEVSLGMRLAVGARMSTRPEPGAPNSPYVDLGAGFERVGFALDRLYVRWQPDLGEGPRLALWAGKFPNPLRQPAQYGELLWDADLQPEGVAATFEPVPGVQLAGGGFLLLTRGNGPDVNLGVLQAAAQARPAPGWSIDGALGGYFFGDIDASAAALLAERNQGNALLTGGEGGAVEFASGFDVWQAHGAIRYDGLPVPVSVGAEYFVNVSAAADTEDSGFAVSGRIGEVSGSGSYALEYRYQDVGQESVFSSLAQDDFLDATAFEGHIVGLSWQLRPFARLRGWTLWSRTPTDDRFQKRFRLDLDLVWRIP